MALQQVSLGGASAPVAPVDLTSSQQSSQSQTNTGGLTYPQYLQDIEGTPFPVVSPGVPGVTSGSSAPTPFTPPAPTTSLTGAISPTTPMQQPTSPDIKIDPFSQTNPDLPLGVGQLLVGQTPQNPIFAPGNPYEWDPFSFSGSGEGSPLPSEKNSPGYQAYGQNWLDLLNTISTQNLKWGGTNDYGGELKGGGSVGPWLSQYILTPYNAGNQNDALANAIYFISSQTGKPASDPETQQLGGAFLDYTLQNANRYAGNTQNFDARRASEGGLFGGIFGDVINGIEDIVSIVEPELAPFILAAQFAQNAAQGNYLGAGLDVIPFAGSTLSDLANVPGLSDAFGLTNTTNEGLFNVASQADAATLSNLGTIGQVANAAGEASQAGEALSQGNFLGALGPGVQLGSGLVSSGLVGTPTGTTGTNAPESGGILSGAANGLGITPQQLVDYTGGAISLGSSAVPLLEQATAGGPPTLNVSGPLSPPPSTPTGPPATPSAAGQPLTAQTLQNPSQANYQPPGPRQANPQELAAILAALGIAA